MCRVVKITDATPDEEIVALIHAFQEKPYRQTTLDLLIIDVTPVLVDTSSWKILLCRQLLEVCVPRCLHFQLPMDDELLDILRIDRLREVSICSNGLPPLSHFPLNAHFIHSLVPFQNAIDIYARFFRRILPQIEALKVQDVPLYALAKHDELLGTFCVHLRKLEFVSTRRYLVVGIDTAPPFDIPAQATTLAEACRDSYVTFFQQCGHKFQNLNLTGVTALLPPPASYYPDLTRFPNLHTLEAHFPVRDLGTHLAHVNQLLTLRRLVFHCRHSRDLDTIAIIQQMTTFISNTRFLLQLRELDCQSLRLRRFAAQPGVLGSAVVPAQIVANFEHAARIRNIELSL